MTTTNGILTPDDVEVFYRNRYPDGDYTSALLGLERRYARWGRERCWIVAYADEADIRGDSLWSKANTWAHENIGPGSYCGKWPSGAGSLWFIFPDFKDAVLFAMALR